MAAAERLSIKSAFLLFFFCVCFPFSARSEVKRADFKDPEMYELVAGLEKKSQNEFKGITISGDGIYREKIMGALQLLQQKSYYDLQYVIERVKRIENGAVGSVDASAKEPVIYIPASRIENYSVDWLASAFVHEACHVEEARKRGGQSYASLSYGAKQKEEQLCNDRQLQALRKISPHSNGIDMLRKSDGLHFDTNKDGKFNAEDQPGWAIEKAQADNPAFQALMKKKGNHA